MRLFPSFSILVLTALLVSALSVPAFANMARPWDTGDTLRELAGDFSRLQIEHEDLLIDLRSFGQSESPRALVEATYHIMNSGDAQQVILEFAAPGHDSSRQVWLDGTLLPDSAFTLASASTGPRDQSNFLFTLGLTPGAHTVKVQYHALPVALHNQGALRFWKLPYILAPAKKWGGFGTLNILALLPRGWEASASPKLARTGDSLNGRFQGIPSDTLILSFHQPLPVWVEPVSWVPAALVVLVGILGCFMVAKRLGRQYSGKHNSYVAFLILVVVVLVCSLAAFVAAGSHSVIMEVLFKTTEWARRGYGDLGWGFLAALVGGLLTIVASLTGYRRGGKRGIQRAG